MKRRGNPDPWSGSVARALRESRRRQTELRRNCERRMTARGVHDLRVEVRRQIALVEVAGAITGISPAKIRRALKEILHGLGKLRELDVQLRRLKELTPLHPELLEFVKQLRRRRRHVRKETHRNLGRSSRKLTKRLGRLIGALDETSRDPAVARIVAHAFGVAWFRACQTIPRVTEGGRRLHRARLAIKHLRHFAEVVRAADSRITVAWVTELRRVEKRLGEIRDLDALNTRMARDAAPGYADGGGLKKVRSKLSARRRQLLREPKLRLPRAPARVGPVLL